MSIGIPPNSQKETKQPKHRMAWLALAAVMMSGYSGAVFATCNNNTNLPDTLVCDNIDNNPNSNGSAIFLGLLLSGWGYMTYRWLKRSKLAPKKTDWEESIEFPPEEWVHLEPLTQEDRFSYPPFSMTWNEVNTICWEIVSEIVWEKDTTSGLLSNHNLQQSAKSWIYEEEARSSLRILMDADNIHEDIHHLLILIKSSKYQQKIWWLLYYNFHHIPLVQKYIKFFNSCLTDITDENGEYLVTLNKEYEDQVGKFTLSDTHLQSLIDRWKAVIGYNNSND